MNVCSEQKSSGTSRNEEIQSLTVIGVWSCNTQIAIVSVTQKVERRAEAVWGRKWGRRHLLNLRSTSRLASRHYVA